MLITIFQLLFHSENLKVLIKSANENGIRFVYALSPGVDIIFSCPKDVQYLKRKMKQVCIF